MKHAWFLLALLQSLVAHQVTCVLQPEVDVQEETVSDLANDSVDAVDRQKYVYPRGVRFWTEDSPPVSTSGPQINFSVIVIRANPHAANLFRDQERVRAFATRLSGGYVGSAQFLNPFPGDIEDTGPPFGVLHPEGSDKRVMVILVSEMANGKDFEIDARQVPRLEAACDDPSQTTIMLLVDEPCHIQGIPKGLPRACSKNIVRKYPFGTLRSDEWPPQAYAPLGPRDSFPFVPEEKRRPTSERPLLFNLKVMAETSRRRYEVIDTINRYTASDPQLPCSTGEERLNASEWQALVLDSKFTVAPGGHNPETFRAWEALEAGSIPIVSKLDYTDPAWMEPHNCGKGPIAWNVVAASPFAKQVSVNDWSELPALLDRLRAESDEYLDQLQADCLKWYSALMEQTYASLLNFGEGHDLFPQDGPIVELDYGNRA